MGKFYELCYKVILGILLFILFVVFFDLYFTNGYSNLHVYSMIDRASELVLENKQKYDLEILSHIVNNNNLVPKSQVILEYFKWSNYCSDLLEHHIIYGYDNIKQFIEKENDGIIIGFENALEQAQIAEKQGTVINIIHIAQKKHCGLTIILDPIADNITNIPSNPIENMYNLTLMENSLKSLDFPQYLYHINFIKNLSFYY